MILSCGEALIDMLPRQSMGGESCFAPYPGGAVFNTSIALGRLGVPASFFSGISTDLFGEILEESLSQSNVDCALSVRSDRPTTLAFVKLVNGQATYAFYDENTAMRMLTPGDLPVLPDDVDALFFGGISLVGEPCGGAYQALMERESPNRVTMIDPNIRPSFITDEAAYRDRITAMISMADIVKLSDEDLAWLYGPGDMIAQAQELAAGGVKLVCITEGAKGAHGINANLQTFVAATKVDVVDTVGAGDTFNAGVLASLHQNGALTKAALGSLGKETVDAALSLGTRSAAVTVSRAGANPPWAREL